MSYSGAGFDTLTLILFFIAVFLLGIRSADKIKTAKDFAIAKGVFNTQFLVMSLIATLVGAYSIIGSIEEIRRLGMLFVLSTMSSLISVVILTIFIFPKINERFEGMMSASDIMGYFYKDEKFKLATAIIGCLACCILTVAQFMAMGYIFKIFLGVNYEYGVIIAGAVITFYSVVGGIRSVVTTDVLQFLVLAVVLPLIMVVFYNKSGGVDEIIASIPESHLNIFAHDAVYEYLPHILTSFIPVSFVIPATIQRYLMCKNVKQIKEVSYIYIGLQICLKVVVIGIAFISVALLPQLGGKEVLPYIIDNYLPTGFKGLAICAIIAAIMSSADSFLNTAGVLLAHNIFRARKKDALLQMRRMTIAIGVFASILALFNWSIAKTIVFSYTLSVIFIGLPLTFALLNFTLNKRLLWGISISLSTVFFGLQIFQVSVFITEFIIIYAGCATYSYFYYKKYGISVRVSDFITREKLRSTYNYLRIFWDQNIGTITDLEEYKNVFTGFMLFNLIFPYLVFSQSEMTNQPIIINMRLLAMSVCAILYLKNIFYKQDLRIDGIFWTFVIVYCLPFLSTIIFLFNINSTAWLVNYMISIFLLSILVSWTIFTIFSLIGSVLGFLFYNAIAEESVSLGAENAYLMMYLFLFSIIISFLFGRKKELLVMKQLKDIRCLGAAIAHEVRGVLLNLKGGFFVLKEALEMERKNWVKQLSDTQEERNLDDKLNKFQEYFEGGEELIDSLLFTTQHSLKDKESEKFFIGDEIKNSLENIFIQDPSLREKIKYIRGEDLLVHAPKLFIRHVIINLINNAAKYALIKDGSDLVIKIKSNKIYFHDTGHGIQSEQRDKVFEQFYSTGKNGVGLGLPFCKMVMEGLDGDIECRSKKDEFTTFVLTFPKNMV